MATRALFLLNTFGVAMPGNKSSNAIVILVTVVIASAMAALVWFLFFYLKNDVVTPASDVTKSEKSASSSAEVVQPANEVKTEASTPIPPVVASTPITTVVKAVTKPSKPTPTKQFIAKVKSEAYLESESVFLSTNQAQIQLFAFGMDEASSQVVADAKKGQCLQFNLQEAVTKKKKNLVLETGFSIKKVACPT